MPCYYTGQRKGFSSQKVSYIVFLTTKSNKAFKISSIFFFFLKNIFKAPTSTPVLEYIKEYFSPALWYFPSWQSHLMWELSFENKWCNFKCTQIQTFWTFQHISVWIWKSCLTSKFSFRYRNMNLDLVEKYLGKAQSVSYPQLHRICKSKGNRSHTWAT